MIWASNEFVENHYKFAFSPTDAFNWRQKDVLKGNTARYSKKGVESFRFLETQIQKIRIFFLSSIFLFISTIYPFDENKKSIWKSGVVYRDWNAQNCLTDEDRKTLPSFK